MARTKGLALLLSYLVFLSEEAHQARDPWQDHVPDPYQDQQELEARTPLVLAPQLLCRLSPIPFLAYPGEGLWGTVPNPSTLEHWSTHMPLFA